MKETILVIGGAGYIGSHVVRQLLASGYCLIVYDNLSKGHRQALPQDSDRLQFYQGELANAAALKPLFEQNSIAAVLNFAALIEVAESVSEPATYYYNNFFLCHSLLQIMRQYQVKRFLFSSTAAIFGNPEYLPIDEEHPKNPCNAYGRSKLMVEWLLEDYRRAYDLQFIALRYFNACGAADDSSIGHSYRPATHLLNAALEVANGERQQLELFGTDYNTPDGTAIRDYVHIEDLATAHVLALQHLLNRKTSEFFNLGCNNGVSVRQMIAMVNQVTGGKLQVIEKPRRPGDPEKLIASNSKAKDILGWQPQRDLQQMVSSAWNWMQKKSY